MEPDELIRSARPSIDSTPTITELRAQSAKRRTRRRTAVAAMVTAVVVLASISVVALVAADRPTSVVADGNGTDSPTSEATDSSSSDGDDPQPGWTVTGEVDVPRSNLHAVTIGSRIALVSDNEPESMGGEARRVSAVLFDPSSAESVDLDFSASTEPGQALSLLGATAWGEALVVMTRSSEAIRLDRWDGNGWQRLATPEGINTNSALGLTEHEGELFLDSSTAVWRSADGNTWTQLPEPELRQEWSAELLSIPAGLLRWTGSPLESTAPEAELWDGESWLALPPSPVDAMWTRTAVWTGSEVIGCGAHSQQTRYDCIAWTPGDPDWRLLDPPPFSQADSNEGFGSGLQVGWNGTEVVVGTSDPFAEPGPTMAVWAAFEPVSGQWLKLPAPPRQVALLWASTPVGSIVYAVGAPGGSKGPLTVAGLEAAGGGQPVPDAVDLGGGMRVRLPGEDWTVRPNPDGTGAAVWQTGRPGSGKGDDEGCVAMRVEFVADTPAGNFPWPGTNEMIPDSTPPCTPLVSRVWGNDRHFTVRVYREAPTTPEDAEALATVLGSFRTERPEEG